MRSITVVSVGRSDYGIYLPLLRAIQADPAFNLHLIVGGMHLSESFGFTVRMIEADGFDIADRVEMLTDADTPISIAHAIGQGVTRFSRSFLAKRPDILVVLGDRYEMFAAVVAAFPFNIPIAHIHGGELTLGAMDDALRHAITKFSHLHFVSTSEYARRVIQLGEEPWRVSISGSPSLDNLASIQLLDRTALESRIKLNLQNPTLLVTFHPVTLQPGMAGQQTEELLSAIEQSACQAVFTLPNADTGNQDIRERILGYVHSHPGTVFVDNLGTQAYFSLMKFSVAMVGNSSSGIIEAASFELPVVNVGLRQAGRVRGINVIDVNCTAGEILQGIRQALSPSFKATLKDMGNPYYHGSATGIITERLKNVPLDAKLLIKSFYDLPANLGVVSDD